MLCLDDPNVVELEGQFVNGDGSFLAITWRDCGSKTSTPEVLRTGDKKPQEDDEKCKSKDEIDDFMREAMLYQVHNTEVFQHEVYDSGVIKKESLVESFHINGKRHWYNVKRQTLED